MIHPGNGPYVSKPDYYNRIKITINIDPRLHERLVKWAGKEKFTRHAFMIKLLSEGLEKRETRQ